MKKFIPFAIAAGLALGGCAAGGGGAASGGGSGGAAMSSTGHTMKDASAAIKAAESELMKAKAVHNEWRDTGKIIKAAKAAEKAGKYDEAVKLADKATRQSENALSQYESQKGATQRM